MMETAMSQITGIVIILHYHEAENSLAAEGLAVQLNLLLDLVHADDAGDEQTGRNGRNRHHDRVRQEVEEVEELHSDDRWGWARW